MRERTTMNRSLCSGLYIILILASHAKFITSVQETVNKPQQVIKSDKVHSTVSDTEMGQNDKEEIKRGWKDNTMQVWGKRSHRTDDSMESKSALNPETLAEHKFPQNENVKRKWGDNNMPVWGKRNFRDSENLKTELSDLPDSDAIEADKRKWDSSSMTVWGKRSDAHDESLSDYNKRKWNSNSMTVWGKRSENPLHYTFPVHLESKRKWGDNAMSVWGKRSDGPGFEAGAVRDIRLHHTGSDKQDPAAKRKWSDNAMQVWGKRATDHSSNEHQHHAVSKRSIRAFNSDYDDVTDTDILRSLAPNGPYPKRGWETNTMRVWGKRSQPYRTRPLSADFEDIWRTSDSYVPSWYNYRITGYREPEKRAWSSDNELRVWG